MPDGSAQSPDPAASWTAGRPAAGAPGNLRSAAWQGPETLPRLRQFGAGLQTTPRAGPQVELTGDGIAELRREIVEGSIPSKKSWWGYDVIQIDDPDGNELLFPVSEQ
jgi:hypothetical protein